MNLSIRISKKTQKNNLKSKVKSFVRKVRIFKYDMLILLETLSLVMSAIACLFNRDKETTYFASLSSIVGAYLVLCATYRMKTHSENKKYEHIISAKKND